MNVGAAIIVKGTLVATPQAKQPFEIQAAEVTVEGASAPDYPLQKKRHSFEYLRTISHLRPRTNTFQAVFRVRSLMRLCDPSVLPGERLRLCPHSADHRKRLRGRRRDVPGNHTWILNNIPKTEDGAVDYSTGLLRKADQALP